MVPPGMHMITTKCGGNEWKGVTSAVSENMVNDVSSPISFFVWLKPGEVLVRKWSVELEALTVLEDTEQVERLALAVKSFEFDSGLGAYPIESFKKWSRLSYLITPEILQAVQPLKSFIFDTFIEKRLAKDSSQQMVLTNHFRKSSIPSVMDCLGESKFYFSDLQLQSYANSKSGSELTNLFFDRSEVLTAALAKYYPLSIF